MVRGINNALIFQTLLEALLTPLNYIVINYYFTL